MAMFSWALGARAAAVAATRRLKSAADTLLGASHDMGVVRDAVLAELAEAANTYTPTELVTMINQLRFLELYKPLGNPTFAIDTNFDIKNTEPISYLNGGTLKTLADNTSFNTGTTATIATAKWGAALLTVNASGTGVVTWFTASGAGYASEALAIAAITIGAATETPMGYATVLAAGSTWTAGTDALQGGTGGTPATTTNYYNSLNPNAVYLGAAVS